MEYPRDFHRERQRGRPRRRADQHAPRQAQRPREWKPPGWRRRERRWHGALMVAITAGLWLGLVAFDPPRAGPAVPPASSAPDQPRIIADFGLCHTGGGRNCVVDGDTFWVGGEKVRIADIDAPETHPPRCAEEAQLGAAATERLRALLNAGPIALTIADRPEDRYGRKLRVVERDGRSLGETLVAEGLARRWEGYRRPWCDGGGVG